VRRLLPNVHITIRECEIPSENLSRRLLLAKRFAGVIWPCPQTFLAERAHLEQMSGRATHAVKRLYGIDALGPECGTDEATSRRRDGTVR
jgi:hypothetical protein